MERPQGLPFWWTDHAKICADIQRGFGKLKIILKTKDDHFFLRDWVEYHAAIVGYSNLIIFDNMSSNQKVLDFYKNAPKEITIAQYDRFHNFIHSIEIFHQLYTSLKSASEYFLLLDTDEFLCLIDNDANIITASSVDFLADNHQFDAFPCTWLYNSIRSDTLFRCGSRTALDQGLRWGKPILRSAAALKGVINHNFEVPKGFYRHSTPTNFFALHMANLNPEQRIQANLRKIIARGFASEHESVDLILSKRRNHITDRNITIYLEEIERLHKLENHSEITLKRGLIDLKSDKRVQFFSDEEKSLLLRSLKDGVGDALGQISV